MQTRIAERKVNATQWAMEQMTEHGTPTCSFQEDDYAGRAAAVVFRDRDPASPVARAAVRFTRAGGAGTLVRSLSGGGIGKPIVHGMSARPGVKLFRRRQYNTTFSPSAGS